MTSRGNGAPEPPLPLWTVCRNGSQAGPEMGPERVPKRVPKRVPAGSRIMSQVVN